MSRSHSYVFHRYVSLPMTVLVVGQAAQGPKPVLVPDALSCGGCRIVAERALTLGAADGPGALSGLPTTIRVDSRGRYWVFSADPPRVYDRGGVFLRSIGTAGRGPGEFLQAYTMAQLPGDSILIVDGAALRGTVLSPTLELARTFRLPFGIREIEVRRWPDSVIVMGVSSTREGAGFPLHLWSVGRTEAITQASFTLDDAELRPSGAPRKFLHVAGSGSEYWTLDVRRYRLARWRGIAPDLIFERKPSWFPGEAVGALGGPTLAPSPMMSGLSVDPAGLIWAFAGTPAPSWPDAWKGAIASGREIRGSSIAMEYLYKSTVEVIDPRTGRLLASAPVPRWVWSGLPDARAATYYTGFDGVPRVDVLQFRLEGR